MNILEFILELILIVLAVVYTAVCLFFSLIYVFLPFVIIGFFIVWVAA